MPKRANKTPKKRKPRSLSKLKKDLDAIFSKYIRQKYARNGICYCFTCNKPMTIAQAQNAHFISRQFLATRWDENNCRPCCVGCNVFGKGQLLIFEENLIAEIGKRKVEALKKKRHQVVKMDRGDYLTRIEFYKELVT